MATRAKRCRSRSWWTACGGRAAYERAPAARRAAPTGGSAGPALRECRAALARRTVGGLRRGRAGLRRRPGPLLHLGGARHWRPTEPPRRVWLAPALVTRRQDAGIHLHSPMRTADLA